MIKFETLPENLVEVLKANDIKEEDLSNRYSDLYIGCKSPAQASRISEAGHWRAMSTIFVPQKGSDGDKYPFMLEIGLAAMQHYVNQKTTHKDVEQIKMS